METPESAEVLHKFLARKRKLNSTEAKAIFERDILGSMAVENGGLKNPIFLVVGGQPASGKTSAIRQLLNKHDPDYTQVVSENELKSFLPDNNRARLRGSHVVEEINRFVVLNWRDQLIEYAIRHRSNIIVETRDTPNYILLARARHIGYKTELNIVATDRITSFTAMHDRYDRGLSQGSIATITSPDAKAHDLSYSVWPFIAASAVCSDSFARIAIIRRTGEIIFENKQANDPTGPMKTIGEQGVMQALMIARNSSLGKTHRDEIQNIWNKLEQSDRFARHLPCANLPIKSYKAEIGLALNNQVDFDPYKIPADDQRHMAEMFVRNVKRDEDFIVANLGDPYCYDSRIIRRITSCHNILQEAFLGKSAIARTGPSDSTFAPQEDTTWGTPHQEPLLRSSIVKRKRTDYASLVNQSPQQVSDAAKLQRPKLLVEVSPFSFSKRHTGAGMANDAALGGMQGEHSAASQEDTAWGTPHQEPLLRSSIVKRKRTASLVNQSPQQVSGATKLQRPKFLVEVSPFSFSKRHTGAGMANDAALGGMQGEHSASALSPSEPWFDDFPEFTEDELAGIDALPKSRSNAAPNLHGTRLNEAFEKKGSSSGAGMANDAALGGMNTVPSAEAQRSSQASPKDFPDLTDSDLADVSELSPIDTRRAAFGTGNRQIRLEDQVRSGPGTSYAHQAGYQSVNHTVFDAENVGDNLLVGSAPIPPLLEDEHIAADFALLGEALHRASPDIAARTRLVAPAVAHFLRMARNPAEAAAAFHDIIDGGRANFEGGTASFVFLPVNNAGTGAGGTHWSLLFVDLRGRQPVAYHYDSFGTLNSAIAQGLAARLGARLDRVQMAQQDNAYDCGVFVVDATRALAAQLAEGERPGSQPLHLDTLVADRQALLDRLTAPSNARVELASSSRSRERSCGGR
ncbi:zeta toxin family protein [Mesorhizobium sp. M1374]|uniref:zeta toxin family protein n=2 Tax=unclassified Mesorhizobium TaxID=325217 RepID=UPI003334FE60